MEIISYDMKNQEIINDYTYCTWISEQVYQKPVVLGPVQQQTSSQSSVMGAWLCDSYAKKTGSMHTNLSYIHVEYGWWTIGLNGRRTVTQTKLLWSQFVLPNQAKSYDNSNQ